MRKVSLVCAAVCTAAMLSGCGQNTYDDYTIPPQEECVLSPVSNGFEEKHYSGIAPTKEETKEVFESKDGLCRIECKDSYYDLTLDYEKGSHSAVGAAYAEAVLLARPDYCEMIEQYLFENIKAAFPSTVADYSEVEKRVTELYTNLDDDYRQELDGFAGAICGNSEGVKQDGILSREEVILTQFIPDALRPTACSALSVNGNKTASGERITCRVLEWQLGSDNQLCQAHTLVHSKNGSKSFTSLTYLGFFPILTAVNDNGVLLAELDVGSDDADYSIDDKTSYTYAMRYALENFDTARECSEYMAENSLNYPFCVNILATDKDDAFVTELVVTDKEGEGKTVIRDGKTELNEGLEWDDSDYLCAVNSYAAKGNPDHITHVTHNIVRWKKYNRLFCGEDNITLDRFKELMTCEKTDERVTNFRSDSVVHMVIADYAENTLQAILTGKEGVTDDPEFIDLGSWK